MTEQQYMADFTLPDELPADFIELLPFQRATADRFLSEGKLIHYALSLESAKLWAVFNANSEMDVLEMIADFPLSRFMSVEVSLLTFFDTNQHHLPQFSLN